MNECFNNEIEVQIFNEQKKWNDNNKNLDAFFCEAKVRDSDF